MPCGGIIPPNQGPLTPSPARDVPRVDPLTADVERFARFLYERRANVGRADCEWDRADERIRNAWRDAARAMVRDLDELEEILAEIMVKGGRF
jgi:hypothetical protein